MRHRMPEGVPGCLRSLIGVFISELGTRLGHIWGVEVDSLNADRGNDVSDPCKRTALIDF
jgi:hypothetical protein